MDKRMRVRPRHWCLLLDFLEEHPELVSGKLAAAQPRNKITSLWSEIATKLNELGMGTKSNEKWKAAFQDWKYKVKIKTTEIVSAMKKQGTEKPESCVKKLNKEEERLMVLTGWKGVDFSGLGDSFRYSELVEDACPRDSSNVFEQVVGSFEEDFDPLESETFIIKTEMEEQTPEETSMSFAEVPQTFSSSPPPLAPISLPGEAQIRNLLKLQQAVVEPDLPKMVPIRNAGSDAEESASKKRKREDSDESSNIIFQKRTLLALNSISENLQSISNEMKLISNALIKLAEK